MEEFANIPLPEERNAPEVPEAAQTVAETPSEPEAQTVAETLLEPEEQAMTETPLEPEAQDGTETPLEPEAQAETPSETQTAAETLSAIQAELETLSEPQAAQGVAETPSEPEAAQAATAPQTQTAEAVSETRSRERRIRRQQRRRWLRGFLCGAVVAGLLAVGGRLWEQRRAASVGDRFVWDFREKYEEISKKEDLTVKIPAWPVGDGAAFKLLREHGETQGAQEVYRNVNPSVVTVIVGLDDETAAVGTGVIFSDDGYFVTNYHVIQGGVECRAMLDSGRAYPALFVAGDERNDLAILKMDASAQFRAAQFGDSELLSVGDAVYAIGNPLGIEFRGTLTNGIISAIDRDVLVDGRTMTLLQTNAALNSGNSGGPLINEYGQVIGINVVKMSSRRSTVEGLGFAIPSAAMERLVNDLLTYGESQPEPVIGVSVDSFGTEVEPDLWGIGVLKVEPDSAAEKGGVKVGDYIIAADGEAVSGSRDLLRVRRRYHVGESMSLTLWRDGERVGAVITFTE